MDISHLNEQQKLAVLSSKGANRIIAGAGSGKTRVITYKIGHLMQNLAVRSYKILAVTFTNKAANEMKSRLINLVGENAKDAWVYTYHAFCVRVLRRDIQNLGYSTDFNIIDTIDKRNVLKELVKIRNYHNLDMHEVKKLSSMISYWKNHQLDVQDVQEGDFYHQNKQQWVKIYQDYLKYLPEYNMIDFDDLLILTLKLFINFSEILEKWQNRFEYILVDEFQDTNNLQFELIRLLSQKHQNITVVGDPDQTIYTFRGAKARLILDFEHYFPLGKTFVLNQNYRSTQEILDVANSLIKHNKSRVAKDLFTLNNKGQKPIIYRGSTSSQETSWIANKIKMLVSKNIPLNNILILYRANYLSRDLEESLIDNNINYRIYGGFKFFERKEIKDVIAYLKVLVFEDQLSLTRVLGLIKGIGSTSISNLISDAINVQQSLFTYLTTNNLKLKPALMEFVSYLKTWHHNLSSYLQITKFSQDFLNAGKYLESLHDGIETDRIDNIKELFNHMKNFDERSNQQLQGKELLRNYLQEISLYTDQDDNDNLTNSVSLMTIHNAKGLEYEYVFILGLNEGIFPSSLSIEEGNTALEEERRVFYVAITRAKKNLFLSYSDGFSYVTNNYRLPSRFIAEINPSLVIIENDASFDKKSLIPNFKFKKIKVSLSDHKALWMEGDIIEHSTFGKGIVTKVFATNIEIAFQTGVKVLRANHPLLKKISS